MVNKKEIVFNQSLVKSFLPALPLVVFILAFTSPSLDFSSEMGIEKRLSLLFIFVLTSVCIVGSISVLLKPRFIIRENHLFIRNISSGYRRIAFEDVEITFGDGFVDLIDRNNRIIHVGGFGFSSIEWESFVRTLKSKNN